MSSILLKSGKIYVPVNSIAQAVFVIDRKIAAVGSNDDLKKLKADVEIDLNGRCVVPGFVDGHGHVTSLGRTLLTLDLRGTKSLEEVLLKVKQKLKFVHEKSWLIGRGWDNENWRENKLPTHHKISEMTPRNPVWLVRVDGHMGLANKVAMNLAKIHASPTPFGGDVPCDPVTGLSIGIFIDHAMNLITKHIPLATTEQVKQYILTAQERLLSNGITQVHDAGCNDGVLTAYKELNCEKKLKLKIYAMATQDNFTNQWSEGNITCRSLKLMIDGALGSRGAWLSKPYLDKPFDEKGNPYFGLSLIELKRLNEIVSLAKEKGLQVCIHAIGDRAVHNVLDVFERVGCVGKRFRIEHLQLVSPYDIKRFAKLGVIASIQPIFATSDMKMAERRVKMDELCPYPSKTLINEGVKICSGSDFPVESENPLMGFYAAITRTDHNGEPSGGWYGHEKMSREETLRSYTSGCAYASFEEKRKGTIEVGKAADLVVLSKDIMTIPPNEILKTNVDITIIDGKVVFER